MTQTPPVIRVAHSPDSDDAFMFWALSENRVDSEGLTFEHHLQDIQTLNEAAKEGKYELTAISYYAYPFLAETYDILTCGSSIGDKYGPLVVAKTQLTKEELLKSKIAVPGLMTSAYLALKLWLPEAEVEVVPFDQIMDKVKDGTYQAGLIIHEGQLTYPEEGLKKIVDLGEWWFEETNLPLPLGGNAIRKDLGTELCQKIARVLRRSVEYGLEHRSEALEYCKKYARGLTDAQIDKFVGMYVNDMTLEADEVIQRSVKLFLLRGHAQGLIPGDKPEVKFVQVEDKPAALV